MNHIYVLENHKLGSWYVGTIKDDNPSSPADKSAELGIYLKGIVGGSPQLHFGHGVDAGHYMAKRFVSRSVQ